MLPGFSWFYLVLGPGSSAQLTARDDVDGTEFYRAVPSLSSWLGPSGMRSAPLGRVSMFVGGFTRLVCHLVAAGKVPLIFRPSPSNSSRHDPLGWCSFDLRTGPRVLFASRFVLLVLLLVPALTLVPSCPGKLTDSGTARVLPFGFTGPSRGKGKRLRTRCCSLPATVGPNVAQVDSVSVKELLAAPPGVDESIYCYCFRCVRKVLPECSAKDLLFRRPIAANDGPAAAGVEWTRRIFFPSAGSSAA